MKKTTTTLALLTALTVGCNEQPKDVVENKGTLDGYVIHVTPMAPEGEADVYKIDLFDPYERLKPSSISGWIFEDPRKGFRLEYIVALNLEGDRSCHVDFPHIYKDLICGPEEGKKFVDLLVRAYDQTKK
jgi:hypothetical protein